MYSLGVSFERVILERDLNTTEYTLQHVYNICCVAEGQFYPLLI